MFSNYIKLSLCCLFLFIENFLLDAWVGRPQIVSILHININLSRNFNLILNSSGLHSSFRSFRLLFPLTFRAEAYENILLGEVLGFFSHSSQLVEWQLSTTNLFYWLFFKFWIFIISEELREHFGQYGEIENVSVKTDPSSGRSRGFAFIVFKDVESIEKVMAAGEHVINNKKVDPKKAKARHGKIFVGGLDVETSEEDIRNFFGEYGTVSIIC